MQNGFLMRELSFEERGTDYLHSLFDTSREVSCGDIWISRHILTAPDLLQLDETGWCVIPNADQCKLTSPI